MFFFVDVDIDIIPSHVFFFALSVPHKSTWIHMKNNNINIENNKKKKSAMSLYLLLYTDEWHIFVSWPNEPVKLERAL